jgi:hypothetical protein
MGGQLAEREAQGTFDCVAIGTPIAMAEIGKDQHNQRWAAVWLTSRDRQDHSMGLRFAGVPLLLLCLRPLARLPESPR